MSIAFFQETKNRLGKIEEQLQDIAFKGAVTGPKDDELSMLTRRLNSLANVLTEASNALTKRVTELETIVGAQTRQIETLMTRVNAQGVSDGAKQPQAQQAKDDRRAPVGANSRAGKQVRR